MWQICLNTLNPGRFSIIFAIFLCFQPFSHHLRYSAWDVMSKMANFSCLCLGCNSPKLSEYPPLALEVIDFFSKSHERGGKLYFYLGCNSQKLSEYSPLALEVIDFFFKITWKRRQNSKEEAKKSVGPYFLPLDPLPVLLI